MVPTHSYLICDLSLVLKHSCFLNAILVVVALFYKVRKVCPIHYAMTMNTLPFGSFLLMMHHNLPSSHHLRYRRHYLYKVLL
jgi:hypothetical protein